MIRQARKEAKRSNHPRYKHGAVLVKGKRILSVGHNLVNRACSSIEEKRWPNTLHAEAHAILKLLKKGRMTDLANATLYVTRVGPNGMLNSKPCSHCMALIHSVGIKTLVYSDGLSLVKEKL